MFWQESLQFIFSMISRLRGKKKQQHIFKDFSAQKELTTTPRDKEERNRVLG